MMPCGNRAVCFGCLACGAVCRQKAISFEADDLGFKYPVIDSDKCVRCGLCERVCPANDAERLFNAPIECYGMKARDAEVRQRSTSGGAFAVIASQVLSEGGVVYGATSVRNRVYHMRDDVTYSRFQGSKYVQSDMKGVHEAISNDLISGIPVLFSGTPCQCASVALFLSVTGIQSEGLTLVDFVCHGVCGPKVFADYIRYCEDMSRKQVLEHRFRDKVNGWLSHTECNVFEDGTEDCHSFESQLFKGIFHSSMCFRDSCYQCPFAREERVSDITLADFWGLGESHPDFLDECGVSFLAVQTEKGLAWVSTVSGSVDTIASSLNDTKQPHLHEPVSMPQTREAFLRAYSRGFSVMVRRLFHAGPIWKLARRVRVLLRGGR